MSSKFIDESFHVQSSKVQYTDDEIISNYSYTSTLVVGNNIFPVSKEYNFYTKREVSKTGVMLVGWGGNNGSTFTAGILSNKHKLSWNDKEGTHFPNYFGSLTQSSTVRLGSDASGTHVYTPFKNLLPMLDPNQLVIGGWDISSRNLADAMTRAKVLDYNLQSKLIPYLKDMVPLPSIYYEDFIAANQNDRADNLIGGTKSYQLQTIRENIRQFKSTNNLEKVVVLWTANTERFSDILEGINDTADNLLASIERGESEVSPSTMFAVAAILEHCTFINGSPQNTFVPGVIELATNLKVSIAGDDFKSGQTKLKSCLVDLLVSAGIKPVSIVSYNHLGNNDGKNLSAPEQFRSKEISKSGVVEDMVDSNRILYKEGEKPDHCVVIKYIPYVGDSKRAMDEYTSEIFMGGKNTIVIHNTCEDSLLATPLIIDLVVLAELCDRIQVAGVSPIEFPAEKMHSVLSILAYLLKAPVVPPGAPVVNALGPQRQGLVNFLLACIGLPPEDFMLLEHKLPSEMKQLANGSNGHHTIEENGHIAPVATKLSAKSDLNGHSNGNGNGNMNGNGNGYDHANKKPRHEIG